MVTKDIILDVYNKLQKAEIKYEIVPVLQYSQDTKEYWTPYSKTVLKTASKLNLFKLKQFDKVIYLDADSLFLKNPDELFNKYDGSIYRNYLENEDGFSGLFVCEPKNHNFDYYNILMQNTCSLDGDLLGNLFFTYKTNKEYQIDTKWFMHILYLDKVKLEDIYGVHFCYDYKPWNYSNVELYLKDFNNHFHCYDNDNRKKIVQKYISEYLIPLKQKFDF